MNQGSPSSTDLVQFRLKTPLEKFSSGDTLKLKSTEVTLPSEKTVKHLLTTFRASAIRSKGSLRAPATIEEFCYIINQKVQLTTNIGWRKG